METEDSLPKYEYKNSIIVKKILSPIKKLDRLHSLVVRVPDYRSRGPGSIPGPTRFSEK
jgi:hypothetical protein